KLDAKNRLKLKISCPATETSGVCKGKVTLKTAKKFALRKGAKKRQVTLGKGSFSVGAGKTGTLTLTLRAKQANLLRANAAARKILAIIEAEDGAGNKATLKAKLKVSLGKAKAAKKHHKH
ncbi:MAG TPA: hypothetical protein VG518_04020, partial [Solirubrobacterales bacterium]|nr:hypothetical protein [Solirubrobacterales bacterium]